MRSPPNSAGRRVSGGLDSPYKTFSYDNLAEDGTYVRLLKVKRKYPGRPITCDLETVDLMTHDEPSGYSALSYAWGVDKEQHIILVNGKTLKVHSNLHKFLVTAAECYQDQPLWIDAICIDQNNVLERGHQVQLMDLIYSQAKHVLLWLGDDEILGTGFEALSDCIKVHPVIDNGPWDQFNEYFWHYENIFDELRFALWTHNYWSRVWVVQEILLGTPRVRVLCGRYNVPWEAFVKAVDILTSWESNVPSLSPTGNLVSGPSSPTRFVQLCTSYHGLTDSIAAVLTESSTLDCMDRRDRVYGVLSLLPDGAIFPVDYTESRFDLFVRFCTHFDLWQSAATVATLFSGLAGSTAHLGVDLSPNKTAASTGIGCRRKRVHLLSPRTPKSDSADNPVRDRKISVRCVDCDASWQMPLRTPTQPLYVWCSTPGESDNSHTHVIFESFSNNMVRLRLAAVAITKHKADRSNIMQLRLRRQLQVDLITTPRDHACSEVKRLHIGKRVFTPSEEVVYDCPCMRCKLEDPPEARIQTHHLSALSRTVEDDVVALRD